MSTRKLISFDWAMKKLLRGKANFGILEGFLSELLRDDIRILEVLDTESNKDSARDKYNRVDLKVKNAKGEILVIEVQYERELDYLQRILYATSRTLDEWIYFLKNEEIKDEFSARGLREAKTKLDVMKLLGADRREDRSAI